MSAAPTLKEQAMEMLQSLIVTATQAGDFIKEQMPIVIKELLAYNTARAVIEVFAGIMLTVAVFIWVRFCLRKQAQKKDRDYTDWPFIAFMPSLFATFAAAFMLIHGGADLIKLLLAPRVWLIEYAASLVK